MSDRFFYIAGPMSGIENYNRPEFEKGATRVAMNWNIPASNIFNPIDHEMSLLVQYSKLSGPDAYRACLKKDLDWICDWATDMYMLRGWGQSKGANVEHTLAVALNLKIHYQ
jgi:hypothetical protein